MAGPYSSQGRGEEFFVREFRRIWAAINSLRGAAAPAAVDAIGPDDFLPSTEGRRSGSVVSVRNPDTGDVTQQYRLVDGAWEPERIGGEVIDLDGVPMPDGWKSDGLPPASAPTVEAFGAIDFVALRLSEIENADPVQVRVYASATSPVDVTGEPVGVVGNGDVAVVRAIDGVPLAPDTAYHFRVVPFDADGDGPASSEVSAATRLIDGTEIGEDSIHTRHLGARVVTAEQIAAGAVTAEKLAALLVLSSRFTTADDGPRVEMNSDGLQAYTTGEAGDEELTFFVPTDPGQRPFWRGRVSATELLIDNRLALGGQDNALLPGSRLVLQEAVGNPTQAPTAQAFFQATATIPLDGFDDQQVAYWGGVECDAQHMYVLYGDNAEAASIGIRRGTPTTDATGKIVGFTEDQSWSCNLAAESPWYTTDFTVNSSYVLVLQARSTGTGQWSYRLRVISKTSGAVLSTLALSNVPTNRADPGIIGRGGNAFTIRSGTAGRQFTTTGTSVSYTGSITFARDYAGTTGFYGTGDMSSRDGYGDRYWLFDGASTVYSEHRTGGNRTGEQWAMPSGNNFVGLTEWGGRMVAAGQLAGDGGLHLITFSTDFWHGETSLRRWVAYTFFDDNPDGGGTFETGLSPKSSYVMWKRAYTKVTTQPIPESNETLNTPTRIRLYAGLYLGQSVEPPDADFRLADPNFPPAVNSHTFWGRGLWVLPASAPPGTNPTFPTAAPSMIKASTGGLVMRGDSSGDWPEVLDPIRDAIERLFVSFWKTTDSTVPGGWTKYGFNTSEGVNGTPAFLTYNAGEVTLNRPGLYGIYAGVKWGAGSAGVRAIRMMRRRAGVTEQIDTDEAYAALNGGAATKLSNEFYFQAGDVIWLEWISPNSPNISVPGGRANQYLTVVYKSDPYAT